MPRIRTQLVTFHALDDIRQHGIGAAREADLLAPAHHEAVEKFDLRARPFCISWPMEGRCSEEVCLPSLKRCSSQARIAASSPSPAHAIVSGGRCKISSSR